MFQIRSFALLLTATLVSTIGLVSVSAQENDTKPPVIETMPDISGEWAADEPLGSLVNDESDQPVNSFRIFKSKEANFKVRYLGSRASRTPLHWDEQKRQFEGLNESLETPVRFVVTPTDDPDVLKCKIEIGAAPGKKGSDHKDTWKRIRKDADVPHATTMLRYEDHPDLTTELKNDVEDLLVDYFAYLKKIGFEPKKGLVTFRVQPQMSNAHYFHSNRTIVMDPLVVGDKTVIRREYNHHALATALGDSSKEIFDSCAGIESGLADYFGCSSCDDPEVGKLFAQALAGGGAASPLRTMDNERSFALLRDKAGRHDVGEVVSGTMWEMRKAIGKDALDPLLCKAWVGMLSTDESQGQVLRFASSLLGCAQKDDPALAKKIREIFEGRGLKLPDID